GSVSRILSSSYKERGSFICHSRCRGGRATYPEADDGNGRFHRFPIWSCSAGGLPCRRRSRGTRCALTAPFHPCPPPLRLRSASGSAVCSLLHFPSRCRAWPLASLLPVGVRTFLRPQGAAILRSTSHAGA